MKIPRRLRWIVAVLLASGAACSSPNPASPPAPPAEIPSFLVIPSNIRISEITAPPAAEATSSLSALAGEGPLKEEIDAGPGALGGAHEVFNSTLVPFEESLIPVDPTVTTFRQDLPFQFETFDFKFDFRPFDFDGDGAPESCSGCTCPVGCAPDIAACPSEAPADQLQPICFRIWVDGKRFMAGLFDRVPTAENQESGTFRVLFPQPTDLPGTLMSVTYDLAQSEDRLIDLTGLLADIDAGEGFFERSRSFLSVEGPEDGAFITARVSDEFLNTPTESILQSQSEYFTNLNIIALEVLASGVFTDFSLIEDVTPPICAAINSASQVADVLCSDLGLVLTPGDFPPLPELGEVQLPPVDQFPESPTF